MNQCWKVCFVVVGLGVAASGADWSQFRGSDSTNIAPRANPPQTWNIETGENIGWSVALPGRGVSSPVVGDGLVVTTSSGGRKPDWLTVTALDQATGEIRWTRNIWATGRTTCHPLSAMSAPTPCIADGKVVVFFASNDLACWDLQGNLLWMRSLAGERPQAFDDRGLASSPLVIAESVIVQVACQGDSFVAGIDLTSGKTLWEHALSQETAWCSPAAMRWQDRHVALVQSADELLVVEPRSGEKLAAIPAAGARVPSLAVQGTEIFLPAAGVTRLVWDGMTQALDQTWQKNQLGAVYASPVVTEDRLYVVRNPGILVAASPDTGDVLWRLRLPVQTVYATPLLAGDRLYIADTDGNVHIVDVSNADNAAAEKGTLLGKVEMGETILGSMAVAGDELFIRGTEHLWKVSEARDEAS